MLAHAQVVVSEIMYNPAGSDSGREWVELYNQGGSDMTLVGGSGKNSWRISDASNHTITDPAGGTGRGSLTIPAGGYLIIANDPLEFISGEYAGGTYSVVKSSISLSNTGGTVSLVDGMGAPISSVPYTSAQGGSDDGASLQLQSDGSWIAALPTPGEENASTPYTAPAETPASSSMSSAQTAKTVSSYVPPPAPSLYAEAGGDRTVIVGADVEFDAQGYDKNQNPLDESTTRFSWNFGDGATAEGSGVRHHFDYPGRYAVVLWLAQNKAAVSDSAIVTAEPPALRFGALPDGGVAIENESGHDLDLSRWIIRQNSSRFAPQFILPEHSTILSDDTMRIGKEVLQFSSGTDSMLEYPNGVLLLGAGGSSITAQAASVATATPTVALRAAAAVSPVRILDPEPAHLPHESEVAPDSPDELSSAETVPQDESPGTSSQVAAAASGAGVWWWAGAGALALVGGVALVLSRGAAKKEWDIDEAAE